MILINQKTKIILYLGFLFLFLLIFSKSTAGDLLNESAINSEDYCENALGWYYENPEYRGEFVRVLEYCKKNAKDVSPEGFNVNPILSDFGSMSGVNTRPRDNLHQGIDIIGFKNQPIIAIKDGKVLETTIEDCWGGTIIIDHGKSFDGKNLIVIYVHVGKFKVSENDIIKRGEIIAELPEKVNYRCMARVRHLHLQIGQRYCKKEEKDNWGCRYFIKDFYRSLNPHNFWENGPNNISCYEKNKVFKKGTITYPFICNKMD